MSQKNPNEPRTRVNLTAGSYSLTASQVTDHEALNRKTATAAGSALSMAEYVANKPELSDESRAALHHIKLDMVAAFQLSWREDHNPMLMCRYIALERLSRTVPLIDEDQKMDLHAPFCLEENCLNYRR